ncbi:hypothetical protein IWX83_000377 [Flavobacterium sp. CG_9.1]|uniref:Uncharacterized protein n=1 Tax=Flavobacterium xanthum TaxID=69322 RepID=A0A1M6ZM50_9FLAO|nr:hypothetical protein [Flavobacterium sp. CG_9.1]MBG6060612.1 hypothetical protein [Flavobacterium sp. CG_9.1]SHL31443.1 hypothetical protein SAMN05443669_100586 [Flavobacterium xanthum]
MNTPPSDSDWAKLDILLKNKDENLNKKINLCVSAVLLLGVFIVVFAFFIVALFK